jgi:predicted phosphate transport protein (TIGR00153 family)
MKLADIISFFIPKDKKFFTLFAQSSENLVAISKKFNELLNTIAPDKRIELIKVIADLEHVGDNITHNIFTELSTNFITPFDREDIHYLASSLDDIVDYIHGSAKRMQLYKIDEYTPEMIQLADVIEKSAIEVHAAVSGLKGMKDIVRVKEAVVRINSLENQADDIFDGAIASLFINEKDAVKIIKVKEILANMETATDKCEDVGNVIETILVKNT